MGTLLHEDGHRARRHRRSRRGLRDLLTAGYAKPLAIGFVLLCVIAGSGAGWLAATGPSGSDAPAPEQPVIVAGGDRTPDPTDAGATTPGAGASPSASPAPSASLQAPDGETVATRIRIDRLGIDLRIIEGDGIDAPTGKAAHYPSSAWPGAGSNTYLYAHAQEGMFLDLWKAEVGDEVVLRLADKRDVAYRVTKVIPKVKWNAVEYLAPTDHEQLTLQTCTSYGPSAPRFIVIAEPEW